MSQEYELSGNVIFAENTAAAGNNSDDSFSPQSSYTEYGPDFEETFGHNYAEHTDKYLSFVHALYTIENDISEDRELCLLLKENRLKLCSAELLNIVYMIDGQ